MSAFLTNRVGDCFLTLGMFTMLWTFGNLDYSTIFSLAPYINENVVTIIGICLLIGAMAKSSQIGLHVWLPLAMEGPTPVSALIHAATMVTAGVYLLMRCSPLIEYSSTVLIICLWIGSITTVFSSLIGLFQQDIKKVIAYSTMSQLAREYLLFLNRTVCVEVNFKKLNNSQITKARDYLFYNHISNNLYNSFNLIKTKWEIIIISKQVGISEAIRSMLVYTKFLMYICCISFVFLFFTNKSYIFHIMYWTHNFSCLPFSTLYITNSENHSEFKKFFLTDYNKFNQWLAGIYDGDGCFILTKKGYVSCEITVDSKDAPALYEIKHKYGGSIKKISGANALRYKLRHKKGVLDLISAVNGLIRNPIRILQLNKLCLKYGIKLKQPEKLTFNNGWFSGLIDSDGSIYFNENSGQMFISITQKNKYLLEPLINLYGGKIYTLSPKVDAFKYSLYRKNEIFNLIDTYFKQHPLKTAKKHRMNLIKDFYVLKNYKTLDTNYPDKFKDWVVFKDKWDKYIN